MRNPVRLTGKELFIYYDRKIGLADIKAPVRGCTNKRVLAKKTGIDYSTLMRVFTRKSLRYYENGDMIILKLFVSDIEKGGQSMARRGRGGMENFARYIMKRD
jgi:lambda repressor-like predicted transcriptional regulator